MENSPPVVEDLALGAFRLVKERLDLELDFGAHTLPILDHYLRELREEDGGRPGEAMVALVVPCAGAYFGEVARRTLPGLVWRLPDGAERYEEWRLEEARGRLRFNPIGAALEALFGEPFADWGAHLEVEGDLREAVQRSLEATGPVREQDYYRLSVRHEVLEQALSLVRR